MRDVYDALVSQDAVTSVAVRHDVTFTGSSGATHQIDVYWEFRIADQLYRTCIECRHYKGRIKKSHVASFAEILRDIGNANGIFVTTIGYQKGAVQIAEANRIRLVRMNRLIQKIVVNTTIKMPRIEDIRFDVDQDDANKKLRAAGRHRVEYNPSGLPSTIRFCDEAGQDTISLQETILSRSLDVGDQELALQGTFIKTEIGPIRLRAIRFTIRHDAIEREFDLSGENVARAVIEDILVNKTQYVHDDGTVSCATPPAT